MANNITYIKSVSSNALVATTTVTTPAFTAISLGNAIVGTINSVKSGSNLASITDNASGATNYYKVLPGSNQFDAFGVWNVPFIGVNIQGKPTTLTFHFTISEATTLAYCIDEYTNVAEANASNALYVAGPTTTPSISFTTTRDNCTIWGFTNPDGATATAGSGYARRLNDTVANYFTEDQVQTTHGAINITWTGSVSTDYMVLGVALSQVDALLPQACL